MIDYGDMCHEIRDRKRELKDKFGVDCPGCRKKEPKRTPTILLPGQRCKVCGYRDPRPRTEDNSIFMPRPADPQSPTPTTQRDGGGKL